MIKSIIFDVDGVLFFSQDKNGDYLWSRRIKEDLGLTGLHLSVIFEQRKWSQIIRGKIDLNNHLEDIFQRELFKDLGITHQDYIQYWLSRDHNINQDMLELVTSLKIPCYLGTNQESLRTNHILNSIGSLFAGHFASFQMGTAKPEAKFFKYIEKRLSLYPPQLLLVDDMHENITAAKKRGWNVYQYQGKNDTKKLLSYLHDSYNLL